MELEEIIQRMSLDYSGYLRGFEQVNRINVQFESTLASVTAALTTMGTSSGVAAHEIGVVATALATAERAANNAAVAQENYIRKVREMANLPQSVAGAGTVPVSESRLSPLRAIYAARRIEEEGLSSSQLLEFRKARRARMEAQQESPQDALARAFPTQVGRSIDVSKDSETAAYITASKKQERIIQEEIDRQKNALSKGGDLKSVFSGASAHVKAFREDLYTFVGGRMSPGVTSDMSYEAMRKINETYKQPFTDATAQVDEYRRHLRMIEEQIDRQQGKLKVGGSIYTQPYQKMGAQVDDFKADQVRRRLEEQMDKDRKRVTTAGSIKDVYTQPFQDANAQVRDFEARFVSTKESVKNKMDGHVKDFNAYQKKLVKDAQKDSGGGFGRYWVAGGVQQLGAELGPIGGVVGGAISGGIVGGPVGAAAMGGIAVVQEGINLFKEFAAIGQQAIHTIMGLATSAVHIFMDWTREIIVLGAAFEKARVTFESMTRSKEMGGGIFKGLQSMAGVMPYSFDTMARSTQSLLGGGVKGDEVLVLMGKLGTIARGDEDRLHNLAFAFTEVMNQGSLTFQRLKQLSSAGIGIADIAQAMGVSTAEMTRRIHAGEVDINALIATLNMLTGPLGRFGTVNEEIMKTASGQWHALQNTIQIIMGTIGEAFNKKIGATNLLADVGIILKAHAEEIQDAFLAVWDRIVVAGNEAFKLLSAGWKEVADGFGLTGMKFEDWLPSAEKIRDITKDILGFAIEMLQIITQAVKLYAQMTLLELTVKGDLAALVDEYGQSLIDLFTYAVSGGMAPVIQGAIPRVPEEGALGGAGKAVKTNVDLFKDIIEKSGVMGGPDAFIGMLNRFKVGMNRGAGGGGYFGPTQDEIDKAKGFGGRAAQDILKAYLKGMETTNPDVLRFTEGWMKKFKEGINPYQQLTYQLDLLEQASKSPTIAAWEKYQKEQETIFGPDLPNYVVPSQGPKDRFGNVPWEIRPFTLEQERSKDFIGPPVQGAFTEQQRQAIQAEIIQKALDRVKPPSQTLSPALLAGSAEATDAINKARLDSKSIQERMLQALEEIAMENKLQGDISAEIQRLIRDGLIPNLPNRGEGG